MEQEFKRYFLVFLIVILSIASFNIIAPFIGAIFGALVLSALLYPIYKKINKPLKNPNLSTTLVLVLAILIIIVPGFFLATSLIRESISAYNFINEIDLTSLSQELESFLGISFDLNLYIKEGVQGFAVFIINSIRAFLQELLASIVYIFLILFLMFYMIRDGPKIAKDLDKFIPLRKDHKIKIVTNLRDTVYAIVHGTLITSFLQGIVAVIGFYLFGFSNPLLWGFLVFVLGIIPALGASVIYVPAAIYLAATQSLNLGIFMFLYGVLIISSIETFLKPRLIGNKSAIHPMIIVLGLFGGVKVWGLVGIVIGPLVLSILFTLVKIYDQVQNERITPSKV